MLIKYLSLVEKQNLWSTLVRKTYNIVIFTLLCSGIEAIKSFHVKLSIKIILLINVKMPTMVGILTFISKINETSEFFKARNIVIFQHNKFL